MKQTALVFFNKKGNNDKSYRLITRVPITPTPPPSPVPRTTRHYPATAAFNYTIHHVSYLAAALIECTAGGVANPASSISVLGVWVLTAMENCIREDVGKCGCIWDESVRVRVRTADP